MTPSWFGGILPQIRLACPYCYSMFPRWQIRFRCTGRPSRSGRRCEPGADEAYAAHFGTGLQLPVFASWRRYRAVCPHCEADTTVRVCPHCHHRLPTQFGRVPSKLVAVVGARDSGKTVMITVLMRELNHSAGKRLGAGVWGADEETRLVFADRYERHLYVDGELHEPTRTVAAERSGLRPPLVFSFATEGKGLRRQRRTLLSFFDTAGEDLRSQESVELNTRYLRSADAVLLVLDPLQLPGGWERAGMAGPPATVGVVDAFQVLEKITDLLQSGGRRLKIKKPLSVAFSKMDLFWDGLKPQSALRQPEPHVAGFNATDGADVHVEVARLLQDWEGGQKIEHFLRSNYKRSHYFGFSALGDRPTADNRVSSAGIQPYRVVDPFLWLLAQLGVVPTIGRR
jgi:hypothetical protein